jgi:hypothetical protein
MKSTILKYLIYTLTIMSVVASIYGCAKTSSVGVSDLVTTYSYRCDRGLPFEPFCIVTGTGFHSNRSFEACRISLNNYLSALDYYYDCSSHQLKIIFDDLIVEAVNTSMCYTEYYSDRISGDPRGHCQLVSLPRFSGAIVAQGIEPTFGVPYCVREAEGYDFTPKYASMTESCIDDVAAFVGEDVFATGKSAQEQYDDFTRNLSWVLDRKANDAVRKFNCYADGNDYCY